MKIPVSCPNCGIEFDVDIEADFPFEMDGHSEKGIAPCPCCKEKAEIKVTLHWKGL